MSSELQQFLASYALRHNEAFAGANSYRRAEYRFLVWRGAGGVGEQMLSLVSAFALALLTDRILIAHSALTDEFVAPFHYGWMVRWRRRSLVALGHVTSRCRVRIRRSTSSTTCWRQSSTARRPTPNWLG